MKGRDLRTYMYMKESTGEFLRSRNCAPLVNSLIRVMFTHPLSASIICLFERHIPFGPDLRGTIRV